MINTKNRVEVRGFVGRYIHQPRKRGDPARFDVGTVERLRTERGELVTKKDWHTIKTFDVNKVADEIFTGTLVEIMGRMDTALVDGRKIVEIVADEITVILTQEQRNVLRGGVEDFEE